MLTHILLTFAGATRKLLGGEVHSDRQWATIEGMLIYFSTLVYLNFQSISSWTHCWTVVFSYDWTRWDLGV